MIEYKPNVGMSVIVMTAKDVDEIFDLMAEMDVIAMRFAMNKGNGEEMISAMRENLEKISGDPSEKEVDQAQRRFPPPHV